MSKGFRYVVMQSEGTFWELAFPAVCLNRYPICEFTEMVNYCLALPYLPGGVELAKKFAQENGNTKEHDEFYRIAGISRETIGFSGVRQAVVLLILTWLV